MNELLLSAFGLTAVFLIAWIVQLKQNNAGWVDVVWSFSVGITGVVYAFSAEGDATLRAAIAIIYLLWFSRLGTHLLKRVLRSKEDGRYQAMRAWAKPHEHTLFFVFYMIQASWAWLFALPGWVVANSSTPPLGALMLGLAIILIAWIGETTADRQLARFVANPAHRGKTCNTGLWRYSRHPNYFFEWLHWFGYPLLGWHSDYALWLWLSPLTMFIFLYFVTGIPYTEQQALRTRGESYRDYQRTTSPFIPWRPRS